MLEPDNEQEFNEVIEEPNFEEVIEIDEHGDPFDTLMSGINEKADDFMEEESEGMLEVRETLKDIMKKPDYGPPLSKEIAESFEQLQVASLDRDFTKRLTEEYRVPENAKRLGVPRVQPEIFKNLLPQVRSSDEQMQLTQVPLSRAIVAQAKVADRIKALAAQKKLNREEVGSIFRPLMDAAVLMGMTQCQLNIKRRAMIRTRHPNLGALCGPAVPVSEYLFGENFDQQLKAAEAASKLIRMPMRGRGTGRLHHGKPYQRAPFTPNPSVSKNFQSNFRGANKQRGNFRGRMLNQHR